MNAESQNSNRISIKNMFKSLGFYDAFRPGRDLWILLNCSESFLFKKINWKLKFLLCSPEKRPPKVLLTPGHPLPCRQILYLGSREMFLCYKYWEELKKPSLRLFLFEKGMENLSSKWPRGDLLTHKIELCKVF